MKCEKCGNNEAVFFYSSDINGQKSQACLCADCAREAGLMNGQAGFGSLGSMLGGMFSDFFAPERRLLSSFGSFGAPVRSIMAPSISAPVINVVYDRADAMPHEESASRIPADAGADIRRRREREALRGQLADAVSAEDYERAAELRDRLRAMEKGA